MSTRMCHALLAVSLGLIMIGLGRVAWYFVMSF